MARRKAPWRQCICFAMHNLQESAICNTGYLLTCSTQPCPQGAGRIQPLRAYRQAGTVSSWDAGRRSTQPNTSHPNPRRAVWGLVGAIPWSFRHHVGVIRGSFGHIWGSLGLIWTRLGVIRGIFGPIGVTSGPSKGSSGDDLGASWVHPGSVGGPWRFLERKC